MILMGVYQSRMPRILIKKKKKLDMNWGWGMDEVLGLLGCWWGEGMCPGRRKRCLLRRSINEGLRNLERADGRVDFVVSHCAPAYVQNIVSYGLYKQDGLTIYLDLQSRDVSF
ncbi:hypothetical protein [Enterocloster clostridioformis]|uniref:hypothetical protein n=1 Tax=Enterocloster clostridioformis TaxID=1531 RepID=UPI00156DF0D8|nr:hypothetical protein [Enterocloster clostridioformis]NSJ53468.1 hypothetical protein [Enterocloster clostridioformis]